MVSKAETSSKVKIHFANPKEVRVEGKQDSTTTTNATPLRCRRHRMKALAPRGYNIYSIPSLVAVRSFWHKNKPAVVPTSLSSLLFHCYLCLCVCVRLCLWHGFMDYVSISQFWSSRSPPPGNSQTPARLLDREYIGLHIRRNFSEGIQSLSAPTPAPPQLSFEPSSRSITLNFLTKVHQAPNLHV